MAKFLTAQEAADYLRVHVATVLRWCKAGKLPAFRIGREWRIREADLEQLVLAGGPPGEVELPKPVH